MEPQRAALPEGRAPVDEARGPGLDGTGPERAETPAEVSQRRFRMLFEQSPAAQVLVYHGQPGMVPNAAFAGLFGYDIATLSEMPYGALVHPDDLPEFEASRAQFIEGVARGDRETTTERTYIRRDGSAFVGRATLCALTDADGRVDFTVATMEDITEQRGAEEALRTSEARFRALVDNSPDIITIVRPDGTFVGSDSGTRLLGYPKDYAIPGGVFSLIHPDDLTAANAAFSEVVAGTRTIDHPHELRLRTMDGEYLDFECVATNLGDHAAIRGVVITARNITERKRMGRALLAARAQFQAVFEHAPVVVSLINLEGNILDINYAGCTLLGRTRQELIGTPGDAAVHPDDRDRLIESTARQLAGSDEQVEFRLIHANGNEVWVMSNASLIDPGGDEDPYVVTIQADITEQRRLQERLALEATRDPLTGVYNRGAFMTELELSMNRRTAAPLAVLFVDLDRFKQVNDTLGHEAGDAVLATIARRMQDCVRAGDVVARLGGDEFVVLCNEIANRDEALAVAERVRATTDRPIEVRGLPVDVGASVGVVLGHAGDNPTELLRHADAATYRAKQSGRGRVEIATDAA